MSRSFLLSRQRFIVAASALFVAGIFSGCVTFPDNELAFCANFWINQSAQIPYNSSPTQITAQILDSGAGHVYTLTGNLVTDERGHGCVQLKDSGSSGMDAFPSDLKLQSLTASMDGTLVDGVITGVGDKAEQNWLEVNAEFDLANPNPGPPGKL